MASFSAGAGFELLPYLSPYGGDVSCVRGDYLRGGQLNGKVYALPYMAGGYALAAMSKNLAGFENKNLAENIFGMDLKKVGKKVRLQPAAGGAISLGGAGAQRPGVARP
ncbi:MAG: hypothetical protein ACLTSK_04605 [Christensenellales bacterium]